MIEGADRPLLSSRQSHALTHHGDCEGKGRQGMEQDVARAKGNKEWTMGIARAKGNKEWNRIPT
jgi:hypothetical protein